MFYVTGDIHGSVSKLEMIALSYNMSSEDTLIVTGDIGFNYCLDQSDRIIKGHAAALPTNFLFIRGNHDVRPEDIPSYVEVDYYGGKAYIETDFPNLIFAKDGEIYYLPIGGILKRVFVAGGAYSVDKWHRLASGKRWFENEQMTVEEMVAAEQNLDSVQWDVDIVLTHTCPEKYIPIEAFLPMVNQSSVDRTMEIWLDKIESKLKYEMWYCGHYHITKTVTPNFKIIFNSLGSLESHIMLL